MGDKQAVTKQFILALRCSMKRSTLNQLEAALQALYSDLSPRVEQLAHKSSRGVLSEDERAEYEQIVLLNDLMAMVKLQSQLFWHSKKAL